MIEHCPTEEIYGDHFTKPLQVALFRNFRAKIMNIPDDMDMGKIIMNRTGLKMGITCKLHNKTNHGLPKECVGDCDKVIKESGDKECPKGGTHDGTYNAIRLDKGEMSQEVSSYADVTREDVNMTLGENRRIIS